MDEEDLFDAYLDLALAGQVVDPLEFLARHAAAGNAELEARLAAIRRELSGPIAAFSVTSGKTSTLSDAAYTEPPSAAGRAAQTPLVPGRRLGDFLLLESLGGGGMGLVFRARQLSLEREVALKVVRPELLTSSTTLQRFAREARVQARLRHPHLVALLNAGVDDGVAWLALELVPGRGLDEHVAESVARGQPLPVAQVLDWGRQLAEGLHAAHVAGLVHRDVKPSNVRIDEQGRARLLDFGVARELGQNSPTLTGPFAGSPAYCAPEQITGASEDIDGRTDVYGLAVTLYECLTGRVPFTGGGTERVFHRVLSETPPSPRKLRRDLPRDLEVVLQKALEKDRSRRYASAEAFARDLLALRELRPIAARPPGPGRTLAQWIRRQPMAAAGALALLLAVGSVLGSRVLQARAEASLRARQTSVALQDASAAIAQHILLREQTRAFSHAVELRRFELHARWFSPDERQAFAEDDQRQEQQIAERAALLTRAQDALALAGRLSADDDQTAQDALRQLQADLLAERYRASRETRAGTASLAGLADQLLGLDWEGRFSELLSPRSAVALDVDPPDAQVHAFVFQPASRWHPGEGRRLVPVPVGHASLPASPGTWALEVLADADPLRRHDLLLEVDGAPVQHLLVARANSPPVLSGDRLLAVNGQRVEDPFGLQQALTAPGPHRLLVQRAATELLLETDAGALPFVDATTRVAAGRVSVTVLRDGELLQREAPAGVELRATAAPLLTHPANRLAPVPGGALDLPAGPLLLVARAPGRAELRCVFARSIPGQRLRLSLPPEGWAPPGYRLVHGGQGADSLLSAEPFWMRDHEITAGEWLHFLNLPEQRLALTADPVARLQPRGVGELEARGLWPRAADGRFSLPADWHTDQPVHGISWDDAQAYVAWLNTRAAGSDQLYALPTAAEWVHASGADTLRLYPFGDEFRSWWTKSCFSRPSAQSEPVLSFPVDESVFGIFDLAGSVSEWCQDWYDASAGRRHYAGGAWAYSDDGENFRCWASNGGAHDVGYRTVGLRPVLRRAATAQPPLAAQAGDR